MHSTQVMSSWYGCIALVRFKNFPLSPVSLSLCAFVPLTDVGECTALRSFAWTFPNGVSAFLAPRVLALDDATLS